jgi:peptidoglycan-N-acetylglucosamine deacetylase
MEKLLNLPIMNSQKPIASLSLDLDNKWSYLKTHGDLGWEGFPSYLEILVPRVLEFLNRRDLTITFFVVGQDAALDKNHDVLREIASEGHEIGNHSFSHEPWLHLYDKDKVQREIRIAEEHIAGVTGQRPIGFRGPGFSFSRTTLEVLLQRGYLYDASTLPTFIGPLARLYYFNRSKLGVEDRRLRESLFGSIGNGLKPLKPYRWYGKDGLLEIPVTTMPVVRLPIHLSYLLYLSMFSSALALAYFRTALALCRLMGVSPSLLLHPLDFLGAEDKVGLDFFPGMKIRRDQKLWLVGEVIKMYADVFRVATLREHALHIDRAWRQNAHQGCSQEPVSSPRSNL